MSPKGGGVLFAAPLRSRVVRLLGQLVMSAFRLTSNVWSWRLSDIGGRRGKGTERPEDLELRTGAASDSKRRLGMSACMTDDDREGS